MSSTLVAAGTRITLVLSVAAIVCFAFANGKLIRQNKLATATNDFAFNLYRAIGDANPGRNVFFSPISISIGLGMVHAGAGGDTRTQLSSAMGLNDFAPDSVNVEFRNLLETLNTPWNNYTLMLANRLFGKQGFTFLKEYVRVTSDYYRAALEVLDFAKEAEASRLHINDWVAEKTADKVRDLLPDGSIDYATVLVLVNAIYFKGLWKNQFDKSETRQRTFHVTRRQTTAIETMTMEAKFLEYFDSEKLGADVLELPYIGGEASMFIFRPHEVEGLNSVEAKLNATTLAEVFANLQSERVKPSVPKFTMEQGVALKQFLQDIGIVDMFDGVKADLSGMDGTKGLRVTEAMHKAFVSVDEEGTEAAGSTGINIGVKSAGPNFIEFKVDHPFLFLIADRKTGSVLFAGRLMRPTQQGDENIGVFGRTAEQRWGGSSAGGHVRPTVAGLVVALLGVGYFSAKQRRCL